MSYYYDFDGNPTDQATRAALFEDTEGRRIARTDVADGVSVSTVWLGLDHRFLGEGPPLLFETMIFGGDHDEDTWRYPNRDAALAGHDQAVALARDALEVKR